MAAATQARRTASTTIRAAGAGHAAAVPLNLIDYGSGYSQGSIAGTPRWAASVSLFGRIRQLRCSKKPTRREYMRSTKQVSLGFKLMF